MPDVLCLGNVVADHVCLPAEFLPGPGELAHCGGTELTVGGCAANVAGNLGRLGHRVGLLGCVGDDPSGRFLRDELTASGVNLDWLATSKTATTACTMVINVRGEDRRFIHAVGANAEVTDRTLAAIDPTGLRVLSLGGFGVMPGISADAVRDLFQRARREGVRTVLDVVLSPLDPGRTQWQAVRTVLAETDLFLPNLDEATVLLGDRSVPELLTELHGAGVGTVILTRGEAGAILSRDGKAFEIASHPVTVVDSTGTGDAFASGFIHGMLREASIELCLRYGAALGSIVAGGTGGTAHIPNPADLDRFVKEYPLEVTPL